MKNSKRLTTEQRQALLMMEFALYRDVDDYDTERRNENLKLLEKIADMGYDTLWGTAAVGYLNKMGEPPVAIPFGWRAKDMRVSGGKFEVNVHYGVKEAFREAGVYDIAFKSSSPGGTFSIDKVVFKERGRVLFEAVRPHDAGGGETVFSVRLNPEYGDMITDIAVCGTADSGGAECDVAIGVHRRVLRPRGAAKGREGK